MLETTIKVLIYLSRATTMNMSDFSSVYGQNRTIVHTGARIITKIVSIILSKIDKNGDKQININ